MGMPARVRRHWTTEDVRPLLEQSRRWPRYELIDGELIVTPSPGWLHQFAFIELGLLLREYCLRQRIGVALQSPADLELKPKSVMQPDVFVIPAKHFATVGESPAWSDVLSLLLAVEIVSPSSAHIDRVKKRDFYMSVDVDEYWVMDLDIPMVERWTKDRVTPLVDRDELVWHPAGAREPFRLNIREFVRRTRAISRGEHLE